MLARFKVPLSWKELAIRTAKEINADDLLNLAAQQAYYFFFALFPALLTFISIASFFPIHNLTGQIVTMLGRFAPPEALSIITDPSVAMILMLVGVYGLIFELGNPGLVLPGVAGAVSLLLGLYALHLLPVNYAGLALMALGIAFIVAEVFVPAYGSLGVGGVVAFVVGALMLIDTDVPGFGLSWMLIGVLALVTLGFIVFVAQLAVRARRRPVVSGVASLVGADGEMLDDATDTGWASIRGETWQVTTAAHVARGQKVRVVAVDGVSLRVAPSGGA